MKKYLFFGIAVFSLNACNKFDDTPKCDDSNVIETLKDLSKTKNRFSADLNVEVFQKYMGKRISEFKPGTEEYKKADDIYRDINIYLEQYIFDKNENGIPKNILPIIKDVVSHHDIPSSLYDIPKINNIRIISIDKVSKTCSCEAELNYSNNNNNSKSIIFSAQKNTDGETYVEVLK